MARNFDEYWAQVMEKHNNPEGTKTLSISVASLKRMQRQAWDLSEKNATKTQDPLGNGKVDGEKMFKDLFGGFGKKK